MCQKAITVPRIDELPLSSVQNLAHPVGAHRRGLRPLQLARPVVWLGLPRPGPTRGDLVQELLDIGLRDLCDQLLVPVRADQLLDDGVVVGRAAWREVGRVFRQIPFDQITDPQRLPRRLALADLWLGIPRSLAVWVFLEFGHRCHSADLRFHQSLGGKSDHLALTNASRAFSKMSQEYISAMGGSGGCLGRRLA